MRRMDKQYVTDCEGPVSLNDNALEMTAAFIPNGESLYAKISRYDDYLADIVKKPGYKAGDTLRLITPFFKAYGITKWMMVAFALKHVLLVPDAAETLEHIQREMDVFIISTSYEPYIRVLCTEIGFPYEHTYSTEIDIDKYPMDIKEVVKITKIKEEIDALPEYELPPGAKNFDDLPPASRQTIGRLQKLFWEELPAMQAGQLLTSVNPVGGYDKARALEDSLMKTGHTMDEVIYVGDSITDVQAFEAVKHGGGLAVSFNGNRYAVENADIALYAESTQILTLVADAFVEGGKMQAHKLLRDLDKDIMMEIKARGAAIIEENDKEKIINESTAMRHEIRGIAGRIG